jgi:hypothetical protein
MGCEFITHSQEGKNGHGASAFEKSFVGRGLAADNSFSRKAPLDFARQKLHP